MKLRLSDPAKREVREAITWYEEQRSGLGNEFVVEFEAALREIAGDPLQFPALETLKTMHEFRRTVVHRFPYLVIFEITEKEVIVVAVAHTSRRPNYWLKRLRDS